MGAESAADHAEAQTTAATRLVAHEEQAQALGAPSACYVYAYRSWGIGFWALLLISAVPGMVVKGPVEMVNECHHPDGGHGDGSGEKYPDWCGVWWYWVECAAIVIFLGFCEGYSCFQKSFSPTLVRRAFEMSERRAPGMLWVHPALDLFLAPLLVPGFLHATTRRVVMNWTVAACVGAAIWAMVHYCPEPHRAFIDTGVALGLTWGLVFILYYTAMCCVRGVEGAGFPPKVTGDYPRQKGDE
eukprot:TRINITY_DN5573_c0_g1_i2.p1 TRINITY_DN5573_c0_g1~~TRINITY_DN5573_c0_g1_i2.p1  ORF type:complete len:243 (+),score=65.00 TRINITY_DN5573_c0_g1_i2:87-815(+)